MQSAPIWDRAKADLSISTSRGEPDLFLWEHSARIAESALQIARLPSVRPRSPDETAITAAALYHDSAWAARVKAGEAERAEVLARSVSAAHREQSATIMETSLGSLIPRESLELASRAIRTLNDRNLDFVEGEVLTEAENLDEFGVLSLWTSIRRGAIEGKGIQSVIDTWHRRKEYHFWTARLNDSFRFSRVRELARKRLDSLERFMVDLEEQQRCADMASSTTTRSAERPVKPTSS